MSEVQAGESNVVPDWLKVELFESVLQKTVPNFKRVINFHVCPAMSAGENYASVILRVEIEVELIGGKPKAVSYIMKVMHDNDTFKELMKKLKTFEKENGMYMDVVPEFEQLYRDAGVEVKFGPQCYKLDSPDIESNILLEDLRQRAFWNTNRLKGLDMEHTKCVLKKLAQWHAASATRVETKGKYIPLYELGAFEESNRAAVGRMTSRMGASLLKCIKTYAGHEIYLESVEKLQANIVDELYKAAKIDNKEFNVLNHGDCWANNIMFQYDAFGKIKETYFLDYQIPKYGTPAQDLYYFLLSSTKYELKLKQFEFFIKYYHDCLVESLTLLKYPKRPPTLKDLHMQLYKYGVWGYSTVSGVMATVLLDPNEMASFDNFMGESDAGEQFKMLMYSNARYRKHIEAILPWLYNRGALEC